MININEHLKSWLPTQPEYRMGYQKVIATLNRGGTERGIIVNSQVFIKESEVVWQQLFEMDFLLNEANKSNLLVTEVKLEPREPETLKGVRQIAIGSEKFLSLANRHVLAAHSATGAARAQHLSDARGFSALAAAINEGAESAITTLTKPGEIFNRFSAYVNDRRITPGGGVTAGTFATTKEDADANIRTGLDAVKRYALPDSKPARYKFTLTPPWDKDTEVKRGTVQPANNQDGGGVEVIFINGLPPGTVTGPETIPEK